MQLTPGASLGLYEIAAEIRAGGTGTVYRARTAPPERIALDGFSREASWVGGLWAF